MESIRTPKGKLFGMYDEETNLMYIKDGKNVRIILVPPTGLTLKFISENGVQEVVEIPPKAA